MCQVTRGGKIQFLGTSISFLWWKTTFHAISGRCCALNCQRQLAEAQIHYQWPPGEDAVSQAWCFNYATGWLVDHAPQLSNSFPENCREKIVGANLHGSALSKRLPIFQGYLGFFSLLIPGSRIGKEVLPSCLEWRCLLISM